MSSGSGGVASLNTDGSITFAPDEFFVGDATFTYAVADSLNASDTSVTVTVAVAASPWKYGSSTSSGRPGTTVNRTTAGDVYFAFSGMGPKNQRGAIRFKYTYAIQGGTASLEEDFAFTTSENAGVWSKNISMQLPAGATVEYQILEKTGGTDVNPIYTPVDGTTTVQ